MRAGSGKHRRYGLGPIAAAAIVLASATLMIAILVHLPY